MTDDNTRDSKSTEAMESNAAEETAEELERTFFAAEAARLPVLVPSRDLWPDIEARLGAQQSARSSPSFSSRVRSFPGLSSSRVRLATAASLLVAATAGITWAIASATRTPADAGTTVAVRTPLTGLVRPASMDATVASIDHEIAALQVLVDDRRSQLDPRTIAVLEENLALIDRAIAESRAALAADPASRFLAAQFARAYSSKLTLLRDVATLPAGT